MAKKGKKKHRIRRLIVWMLVLALLGAGVYFVGLPMLKAKVTTTYDEYTATIGSISNALSFSGSLALKDSATLTAGAETTVRNVYVTEGQKVQKGDKLIRLANGETLKADFDGTVNLVNVAEGDDVSASTQLLQYADFEHMQVSIRVDEYDISDVSVGQACTVTATALERSFSTTIDRINYISQSGGSVAYYTATADVTVDEGVYPGMQVSISIPQQEALNVVVLKMDALSFGKDNSAYVYMKDEAGELIEVPVEVGVNNGNYVEITSGLNDGDVVYVEVEEEVSAASGLMSLFGGGFTQFNGGMGGGMGGFDPSSMGGMGGFDPSSMGGFDPSSFGGGGFDPSSMGGGMGGFGGMGGGRGGQ